MGTSLPAFVGRSIVRFSYVVWRGAEFRRVYGRARGFVESRLWSDSEARRAVALDVRRVLSAAPDEGARAEVKFYLRRAVRLALDPVRYWDLLSGPACMDSGSDLPWECGCGRCIAIRDEPRRNHHGNPILGDHPECVCDGDLVSVWECGCPECRSVRHGGVS